MFSRIVGRTVRTTLALEQPLGRSIEIVVTCVIIMSAAAVAIDDNGSAGGTRHAVWPVLHLRRRRGKAAKQPRQNLDREELQSWGSRGRARGGRKRRRKVTGWLGIS